jgi:ATP-dependent Clp protease ATP-binding subunit ClpX
MVERRKRRTPAPATATVLCCSFCGTTVDRVDRLIAGPGVYICNNCVGLCNQLLAKESLAAFDAPEDKDDDALLASMARLDVSRQQVAAAVDAHARILRQRGVTWTRLGTALGISKQSAYQRFSAEM